MGQVLMPIVTTTSPEPQRNFVRYNANGTAGWAYGSLSAGINIPDGAKVMEIGVVGSSAHVGGTVSVR